MVSRKHNELSGNLLSNQMLPLASRVGEKNEIVPRPSAVIERQESALALRRAGLSYGAIATELGYRDPSSARKAVARALERGRPENIADVRTLESSRLDAMLQVIWPDVEAGHYGAIDRALRLIEIRARLLGLGASQRPDTETDSGNRVQDQLDANAEIRTRLMAKIVAKLEYLEERRQVKRLEPESLGATQESPAYRSPIGPEE